MYQPLFLLGYDKPVATVFGSKRTAQIPKFEIWKLKQDIIGSVTVNTPPPFSALTKKKNIPTPKGKMALIFTPLYEQSLVNKTIEYEIVTRYTGDFAGQKRARAHADAGSGNDDEADESADVKNVEKAEAVKVKEEKNEGEKKNEQ